MWRQLLTGVACVLGVSSPALALEAGKVWQLTYTGQPFTNEYSSYQFGYDPPEFDVYEGPARNTGPVLATFLLLGDLQPGATVNLDLSNPYFVEARFPNAAVYWYWQDDPVVFRTSVEGWLRLDAGGRIEAWDIYGYLWTKYENYGTRTRSNTDVSARDEFLYGSTSGYYGTSTYWNEQQPGNWSVAVIDAPRPLPAIPEPAEWILLAVGLPLLLLRRRQCTR